MPVRRFWGLQLGRRLRIRPPQEASEAPDDGSVCRICWQGKDEEEGGDLLAPCRCSGSVKYVHRRCLEAWQRTQRSQGALRKSFRCDICRSRYRVPRAPFSGPKLPFCRLPTWNESRELVVSFVDNPAWQVVLDGWKMVVLVNGLLCAPALGVVGFEKGFDLVWPSVQCYGKVMLSWGPELLMAAMAFPVLQLPLLLMTVGSGALVVVGLAAATMLGYYAGALCGFALGSMQILKATADLSGDWLSAGFGHLNFAFKSTLRATTHATSALVPLLKTVCRGRR